MSIEYPVQQGSAEWMRVRLGIPTASMFHEVICPTGGEPLKKGGTRKLLSDGWKKYGYKLVAERLLNEPMESVEGVEWMERGQKLEPMAAAQYQFLEEVETRPAGFFTTDDGLLGASPDRIIVGKAAGIEIKSPAPWRHLRYLLDGPGVDYRPQVQGQMLVCDFDFVDFYSYSERMPAHLLRTHRDERYIDLLRSALAKFCEKLADMERRARALGVFQAAREAQTPAEIAQAQMLREDLMDEHGLAP